MVVEDSGVSVGR